MPPVPIILNTSLASGGDADSAYIPYSERPETYIVPLLFFLIFGVGVVGNGTLVSIFMRNRTMRNVTNTYILSLALADLLLITTCVPFTSIIYTVPSWPWGVSLCKTSETSKTISIAVSVFTLTALSAERYCAIVNPLRRLQSKPMTVLTASVIWIAATILAIPDAVFSHLAVRPLNDTHFSNITICTPFLDSTYSKWSVACKALIFYVLPLCIISAFYILMARRLHATTRDILGEVLGHSAVQIRARRHVARMVLAIVFLFFVCFFPYNVFMLWAVFNPNAEEEYNDFWHAFRIAGYCLSFLNSCVNPIALYFVSRVFRQHFNRYLCCKKQRRIPIRPTSNTICETSFNSNIQRANQSTLIEHRGRRPFRAGSPAVVRRPLPKASPVIKRAVPPGSNPVVGSRLSTMGGCYSRTRYQSRRESESERQRPRERETSERETSERETSEHIVSIHIESECEHPLRRTRIRSMPIEPLVGPRPAAGDV